MTRNLKGIKKQPAQMRLILNCGISSVWLRVDSKHLMICTVAVLCAGVLLLAAAAFMYQAAPRRADLPVLLSLGACLFLNQLGYIYGLQLAGVTLAACMQPSIPVLTVVISMAAGQEAKSLLRLGGVLNFIPNCRFVCSWAVTWSSLECQAADSNCYVCSIWLANGSNGCMAC
jgi:EamA-like transporter family